MSDERRPVSLELIAKQKAQEKQAKQAQYNAGILGGPMPPQKRFGDLPLTQISRLCYARGLMMGVEFLWQETVQYLHAGPEHELGEIKVKAQERIAKLEQAIELLKMVDGV